MLCCTFVPPKKKYQSWSLCQTLEVYDVEDKQGNRVLSHFLETRARPRGWALGTIPA